MNSRVNRYYNEEMNIPSRQAKNMELYKEINATDIEDYNVNSNISVIDDDGYNIDIQRVRDILDKKYRETPKDKKIADYDDLESESINLDETRDYDINTILEKAKEKKEVNYEIDRLKKIRNTQFDILNSLDLDKEKKEEDTNLKEEQTHLMELINTITSKELVNSENLDPLDILTELKGDENTVVIPGIKDEEEDTKEEEVTKELIEEVKKEETKLEDTFNTNSLAFTESDFDDFNDLKEDVKSNSAFIKVLTVLVIIVLLFGIFFMLNAIFDWGLFVK